MPTDLIVKPGTSTVLDANPPVELIGSFKKITINTLEDFVEQNLIESPETVKKLLDAAKNVTKLAMSNRNTFTPAVKVPGTSLPDLRRFGSFITSVPEVNLNEANIFWRAIRLVDPKRLTTVGSRTNLTSLSSFSKMALPIYLFENITIEENSNLIIKSPIQNITCSHLLIKRTGRILVQGSGVIIKAYSIKGE